VRVRVLSVGVVVVVVGGGVRRVCRAVGCGPSLLWRRRREGGSVREGFGGLAASVEREKGGEGAARASCRGGREAKGVEFARARWCRGWVSRPPCLVFWRRVCLRCEVVLLLFFVCLFGLYVRGACKFWCVRSEESSVGGLRAASAVLPPGVRRPDRYAPSMSASCDGIRWFASFVFSRLARFRVVGVVSTLID